MSWVSWISWMWNHQFETLVIASILCIVILACLRYRSSGTWSEDYYYVPPASIAPRGNAPGSRPRKDSQGEIRCRQFLERYFKCAFPKRRPEFMVNPVTGSQFNLELDCFNESLKLAVEYNGAQHYQFIPFFHKNQEAFYNQKYRDELKRMRCREMGITLIEVPHTEDKRLEAYLEEQLKRHGFTRAT
jgi:hypothetical protein